MIAVDTNLLVYAHREDSPWHGRAFELVRALAEGAAPWAIPWPCLHEFLAVVTHPRIFDPPTPLEIALDQVEAWIASPSLVLLAEGPMHWERLRENLAAARLPPLSIGGGASSPARFAGVHRRRVTGDGKAKRPRPKGAPPLVSRTPSPDSPPPQAVAPGRRPHIRGVDGRRDTGHRLRVTVYG